jgi:predicted Zn-dependent protease
MRSVCFISITVSSLLLGVACAKSPTGRPQLLLVSDADMAKMGVAAFNQAKAETPPTRDQNLSAYVRCVATAITQRVAPNQPWEVVVFDSDQVNAFALPGGKIGVYAGLFRAAETPDQLATVVGHEIAHVIARHGNARVSAAMATETGLTLTSLLAGGAKGGNQELLGLLGTGAQVGILLPYSRAQESEADALGLDYMAQAGFHPPASVELWRNMERLGGSQPPAFLSTHPSHGRRIDDLTAKLPEAVARSEEARKTGNLPQCTREGERPAQVPTPPLSPPAT